MPTADQRTDAELIARHRDGLADLARETVRVEVDLGPAHWTCPPTQDEDTLVVVEDPEMITELFAVLETADLASRSVAQILAGVRLTFIDAEDDSAGSVDLLSPTWIGGDSYAAQLARPVLPQVLDGLMPAIWPEGQVEDHLLSSAPEVSSQDRALRALWEHRWGLNPEDVGNLRPNSDRWVRFHSLPGSKQYADDEAEYQEILRRHRVLLEELASGEAAGTRLVVVVGSWSTTPVPAPLDAVTAGALPGAQYGWTVLRDEPDQDDDGLWDHYYVDRLEPEGPVLDALLRVVADCWGMDVVIAPPGLEWLYVPYDGGADVYAASAADRNALRDRHADWLSSHPDGL